MFKLILRIIFVSLILYNCGACSPNHVSKIQLPNHAKYEHFKLVDEITKAVCKFYYREVPLQKMLEGVLIGIEKVVGTTGLFVEQEERKKILSPLTKKPYAFSTANVHEINKFLKAVYEILQYSIDRHPNYSESEIVISMVDSMSRFDPRSYLQHPAVNQTLAQLSLPGNIGLLLIKKDGKLIIFDTIWGSPAERVGLIHGDILTAINGDSVEGLGAFEAANKLAGPADTSISITVTKVTTKVMVNLKINRETSVQTIHLHEAPTGYSHIWINHFLRGTSQELKKIIEQLKLEKSFQGVIIDLRYNSGGPLNEVIEAANIFLDGGVIGSIKGRYPTAVRVFNATSNSSQQDYPLIVLINEGTMSGAEIIAASLLENRRALILGTRSFGIGAIDIIEPLSNGYSLRFPVAQFFTPKENKIEGIGVSPSIDFKKFSEKEIPFQESLQNDPLVSIAFEVLKRTPSNDFTDMMSTAKSVIERYNGI